MHDCLHVSWVHRHLHICPTDFKSGQSFGWHAMVLFCDLRVNEEKIYAEHSWKKRRDSCEEVTEEM